MGKFLNRFGAALIDMDGVLYDSMKWHTLAWKKMMESVGVECDRDEFYLYEGMTGEATIDLLFRRAFGHHASGRRSFRALRAAISANSVRRNRWRAPTGCSVRWREPG